MYVPGPGRLGSGYSFSTWMTYLWSSSLLAPKQNVTSPFTWTENVDVVLSGLNTVGMLYLSGEGLLSIRFKEINYFKRFYKSSEKL